VTDRPDPGDQTPAEPRSDDPSPSAGPGTDRGQVLREVVAAIEQMPADGIRRVGVDGVDGAGKSIFADALAVTLGLHGEEVIRASVDDFHHPRRIRYRRGRDSPEGFYLDSFDLEQLRRRLLDPLGPGGDRRFVRAIHDVASDQTVEAPIEEAAVGQVLVVDGLFLHRSELRGAWDLSIYLDVPFAVSVARVAERDGCSPDPGSPTNRRYVEGQRRYVRTCRPTERATVVVDNSDHARPAITKHP
jgi:uridine kinase